MMHYANKRYEKARREVAGVDAAHWEKRLLHLHHLSFRLEWWHKPILSCPICMPSLWGVIGIPAYLIVGDITLFDYWQFLPAIVFAVVINNAYIKLVGI